MPLITECLQPGTNRRTHIGLHTHAQMEGPVAPPRWEMAPPEGEGGSFPLYGWTSKNYVICVCFHCHRTSYDKYIARPSSRATLVHRQYNRDWGTSYSRPPIDPYLTSPLLRNPGGATDNPKMEQNTTSGGLLWFDYAQTFVDKLGEDGFMHCGFQVAVGPRHSVEVTEHSHEVPVCQHVMEHGRLTCTHTHTVKQVEVHG